MWRPLVWNHDFMSCDFLENVVFQIYHFLLWHVRLNAAVLVPKLWEEWHQDKHHWMTALAIVVVVASVVFGVVQVPVLLFGLLPWNLPIWKFCSPSEGVFPCLTLDCRQRTEFKACLIFSPRILPPLGLRCRSSWYKEVSGLPSLMNLAVLCR